MATIGTVPGTGITVDILKGLPQSEQVQLDIWKVPGLDGFGAQTLGISGEESEFITVTYVDPADADDYIGTANLLQGTIVDMVDDWGSSFTLFIVHLDTVNAKQPCIYKGAASCRIQLRWRVMVAEDGE